MNKYKNIYCTYSCKKKIPFHHFYHRFCQHFGLFEPNFPEKFVLAQLA